MSNFLSIAGVVSAWGEALIADATLAAWCQTTYSKDLSVYVGLPRKERDRPTGANCPYILIVPGSSDEGEASDTNSYTGLIGWSVLGQTEPTESTSGVQVASELTDACTMGEHIKRIINAVDPNAPIYSVATQIEAEDFLPEVVGNMEVVIQVPVLFGYPISYGSS